MKRWLILASLAVGLFLIWALVPYLLPTKIALGPCGRDWTSPTSYRPKASPMRSARFEVGDVDGKVCYGSPAVRGRTVFGELVPYGELWRTGANEPTRLFVDGAIVLAGIELPAGRYSLYTAPGPETWQLFVSRSTFHWGNEITPDVRSREVGSAIIESRDAVGFVEQLTIEWESGPEGSGVLTLEWEETRLEIPLASRATYQH